MPTVHETGSAPTTGFDELNHQLELAISGMTCASCAARIEKKLNRLKGVRASVNFATEKARVRYADGVIPGDLVATVVRTDYTAEIPCDRSHASDSDVEGAEFRVLRERLVGSTTLAVQVFAMSMAMMIPGLRVPHNFEPLSMILTAPVVAWGAWPFHRAAWRNIRHGAATMDTLISIGVWRRSCGAATSGSPRAASSQITRPVRPITSLMARFTLRLPLVSRCSCLPVATSRHVPKGVQVRRYVAAARRLGRGSTAGWAGDTHSHRRVECRR